MDVIKSEFYITEVKYLGLIITIEGIKIDLDKVKTILKQTTPRTTKDILSFLNFANFYRIFITGFGRIALSMTSLTKKDIPFRQIAKYQKAFKTLKQRFTIAPILTLFDPDLETFLEVNSFNLVTVRVLSQIYKGVLRLIAFFSRKILLAEYNYKIYDKELIVIIRAFEEQRPELASIDPLLSIRVLSNYPLCSYVPWFSDFPLQVQFRKTSNAYSFTHIQNFEMQKTSLESPR